MKEQKPSSRKTNKTADKHEQYERICQQSFGEAIRNFQCSTNALTLEIPLNTIVMQKPLSGRRSSSHHHHQTNSAIEYLNRIERNIKTSYVSKSTFAENKAERMACDAYHNTSPIPFIDQPKFIFLTGNLMRQLTQSTLRNSMQIRGFRTQRNIESQLKRNPSFLSRIQDYFGKMMNFNAISKRAFS